MSKIIEVYSKGERYEVVVDNDIVFPSKVYKRGNYYVCVHKRKYVLIHRWIMGVTNPKLQIDHIDNNTANNKKENLRICTHAQNQQNIKNKGYSFHKKSGKYQTRISKDGKLKHLGYYKTPEEAQQVYRKAHAEAFGEFSPYYKYDSGITEEEN